MTEGYGPWRCGKRENTYWKISRLLYRFSTRNRSLYRCALSLACPQGRLAAGAENSFSMNRIVGIEPPSRMKIGWTVERVATGSRAVAADLSSDKESPLASGETITSDL